MTEPPFVSEFDHVAHALQAWAALRCRGPLGRAVDPDDLVQEVCVEAIAAYDRFDPERGSFRAWLFGVAHRVANNLLRRLARGTLLAGDVSLASRAAMLPAAVTTISRRVSRDESVRAFVDAIDDLSDEDRKLLVHRGLEGLPHDAVAELLGISPENAAKRWQRLRDRIRDWPTAAALLHDS